ncbi:MAG: hypothetical protein DVB22_000740 [Verrucomicrobia bacterium]|nr:MAG: hypothetical protein DVB22_000740 [Verrucomicrobiota bacterium]
MEGAVGVDAVAERAGKVKWGCRGCGGEREGRGGDGRGEVWGMRAMKFVIGVLVMAVLGVRAEEAGTAPMVVKVLVLNYDPVSEGKRLHELFGWNNPRVMAKGCIEDMEKASGGRLRLEIAEWRDLDEIYAREDGGRYTVEEYVRNRRSGKGWVEKYMADYPRIFAEQRVAGMIDDGRVDEVWIFSDHYFGIWEASMAGPGAFFINGGVYPEVPVKRPFAFYGFNYERGVAEMLHNASHRTECTMNRIYGQWDLKRPRNNWEKFSANAVQSGGVAGVGTCHWPPNAVHDYDYSNLREVESWADDFLNYPELTGKTKKVSVRTWSPEGGDTHRDYMRWYFERLPKAAGVNADGRVNNWWRYLYDFGNYGKDGKPLSAGSEVVRVETGKEKTVVRVALRSAGMVRPESCVAGVFGLRVGGVARAGLAVEMSDARPGGYRVAAVRIEPGLTAEEVKGAELTLKGGMVSDLAGQTLPEATWTFTESEGEWRGVPERR